MSTSELLVLYALLVFVSSLFSPEQIVALLERDGRDTAHYAWAYLLLWAIFSISLIGLVIYAVKKASKT